jgi:hypothetical protein
MASSDEIFLMVLTVIDQRDVLLAARNFNSGISICSIPSEKLRRIMAFVS